MRGSSDTRLILVKHSLPDVDPAVPAARWRLSEEGRQRCLPLANQLAAYQPAAIIASTEPKATETAELVARHLHLPFTTAAGLHEHDRSSTAFLGPEEFQRAVQKFFRQRDTLVLGQETANQAEERFTAAVMEVLQQHLQKTIVIVAHGTIISLFAARHAFVEPFPLWQSLVLPSFVVLSSETISLQPLAFSFALVAVSR